MKNCLSTIEGLPIDLQLRKIECEKQNSYGYTAILSYFSSKFWTIVRADHQVAQNQPRIANASHDDLYLIIIIKIFSEGRRQEKYVSSSDVHPRKII